VSTYQVQLGGTAVDKDFYDSVSTLEVEENSHLPDALRLVLPATVEHGELKWAADDKLGPYANIAVVATPDGGSPQCIFDGYVLSHRVHIPAGVTAANVEIRAQDASVLMGVDHKTREWAGQTEGSVANQVFGDYGFTPADGNTDNDSAAHDAPGHTLMQRGTDLEFLRRLARRSGKWCRVYATDAPGRRTGFFAAPDLGGDPVTTIVLNDPDKASVDALDFHWDVARPSKVLADQASLCDRDPVNADTDDGGLPLLDARGLAAFAGKPASIRLTTPGDSAHLAGRAAAALREASWFAGCEGVAQLSSLHAVLRVGTVVAVEGVGAVLSGKYLVSSVRHTIGAFSHTMAFTLVRNAVGPAAGGGLPGLPGGL
jgi:phage protein D